MNFDTMIKTGKEMMARRIRYSMNGSRTGSDGTADCSGFVYKCLISGGVKPMSWVPNTDSMHSWLLDNGYKLITHNGTWNAQKGDVTIFGLKGASGGAAGHVILWLNGNDFIHCTYKNAYNNGVYIEPDSHAPYNMGHWYTYRYMGSVETPKPNINVSSSQLDTLARDVIRGYYGNGNERKENLFKAVQNVVNLKMQGKYYKTNNSIEYLTTLIIQGKLGNGETRKNNIYNLVQKRVNELV